MMDFVILVKSIDNSAGDICVTDLAVAHLTVRRPTSMPDAL